MSDEGQHATDAPAKPRQRKPRTFWGRLSLPTKILIGMAVGTVLGLLLGPRSPLLDKDVFELRAPGDPPLYAAPSAKAAKVRLGGGKSRLALRGRQVRDPAGPAFFELKIQLRKGEKPGGATFASDTDRARRIVTVYLPVHEAPPATSRMGHGFVDIIGPIGTIFLRLIKMVIVPLVFASLLIGVASLGDLGKLGRMGGLTLGYFLVTTAVAITIGLLLANTVRPGSYLDKKDRVQLTRQYGRQAEKKTEKKPEKSFVERLVDIVPDHPLGAATQPSPDMLQVIFFAIFLGVAFVLIPADRAKPALAFFDAINEVMIKIVNLVMELAPYGVLALLAQVAGTAGGGVLRALGVYCLVVIAGLAIHATVTYGLAVKFLGRYPLGLFYRGIRRAQLIAFSTSSSSATLPVSIRVAQENLGTSSRAASFVLPLGATVNMDGTALYQGVAAVFIAQVFGMDLSVGQQLEVLLTATLASVGAAGVPGAGIVTLAMVLLALGIPEAGIALILGVDRLLDMFRTSVNVTGDLSATVIVAQRTGEMEPAREVVSEVDVPPDADAARPAQED